MARFAQDKLEELRDRANIVEVIGTQVRLKRAGRNYVGLCPFHNEKTPSFSVNAERGFFHCFGCGAGGTVFDFLMRLEGLTFPEAVQSLARRYGVTLPESQEPGAPPPGEREAMYRANEFAAAFFGHLLWKTPAGEAARGYLKRRSLSEETARAFIVGLAPAQPGMLANALKRRGLLDGAIKTGLIRRDGAGLRDLFIGRLMFPIRDAQGRVVAFGGRVLDERLPKYINSSESPVYSKARNLYGLYEARQALGRADRAIVVEGYFDAIAVSQAGFKEVVASLGTSLTVDQLRVLARYTRNVIACFDGDEAGRKASMRALEVFLGAGLLGRGIFVPSGFDPDTLIQERGAQTFDELVNHSELLVDMFVTEESKRGLSLQAPIEQRLQAAQRIGQTLRLIPDELEFNALVAKTVDRLALGPREEKVIREQARSRAGRPASAAAVEGNPRLDAGAKAELGILGVAIIRPELRPKILEVAPLGGFDDQRLGALVVDVCALAPSRNVPDQWLFERLSQAQRERLSALTMEATFDDSDTALKVLNDYIRAMTSDRRTARDVEAARRGAADASDGETAVNKAQEVIALRRGASHDPA
ncbi:MAG TPA: DNA primase [Candidatus Binataceae bacterium]|nr:DNA primase [Candidatus Binataceae bacterium]HVB80018.1 DNA primase [Candidatus Binataceae bacterium]